ncbi:protein takeout [Anabrus simplex]|uniref:protein takeout n=1 Tax=Anabrus simplex TaxID=316456 RepID=UPI0035A39AB4
MEGFLHTLAASVVLWSVASASQLPPYIKTCAKNNPNLNDCIIQHGREALPYLVGGDPKIKFPALDPMRIPEVKFDHGLTVTSRDVEITGLRDANIDSIRVDLDKQHVESEYSIPRLQIVSNYEVTGKILSLPIQGNGVSNFTFVGNKAKHSFDFDLVEREGKKYAVSKNGKLQFDLDQAYFSLSNLFNGDQTLGDAMNAAINENWKDVVSELKPDIEAVVQDIIKGFMDSLASNYSFDEIFPDTD